MDWGTGMIGGAWCVLSSIPNPPVDEQTGIPEQQFPVLSEADLRSIFLRNVNRELRTDLDLVF
jgi:hypothetical protein